ncbi:MAG: LysM peptidoglycan-binding domain-containing protein [Candidatus Riflebacteria bacterium]|nr:LysM peptidoglycan-binding domain-containing protein [Candidatus Riflebacteria bacterium]
MKSKLFCKCLYVATLITIISFSTVLAGPFDDEDLIAIQSSDTSENMRSFNKKAAIPLSIELSSVSADWNPSAPSGISNFSMTETASATIVSEKPLQVTTGTNKISKEFLEINVKPGDNLISLAKKYLGDGSKYLEIVNLNKDKYPSLIKNPSLIRSGWVLKIKPFESNSTYALSAPIILPIGYWQGSLPIYVDPSTGFHYMTSDPRPIARWNGITPIFMTNVAPLKIQRWEGNTAIYMNSIGKTIIFPEATFNSLSTATSVSTSNNPLSAPVILPIDYWFGNLPVYCDPSTGFNYLPSDPRPIARWNGITPIFMTNVAPLKIQRWEGNTAIYVNSIGKTVIFPEAKFNSLSTATSVSNTNNTLSAPVTLPIGYWHGSNPVYCDPSTGYNYLPSDPRPIACWNGPTPIFMTNVAPLKIQRWEGSNAIYVNSLGKTVVLPRSNSN